MDQKCFVRWASIGITAARNVVLPALAARTVISIRRMSWPDQGRMMRPVVSRAAALWAGFCLVWMAPVPALAQLPLAGSAVVTITSPSSGSTVSGTTPVSASVSIVGSLIVRGVQFQLDGANLGAEDTSAPYSVSWDTTQTSNGSHTLVAVARDLLGVRWTSDPVTVTVSNGAADSTPPTVAITSPASGATVSGTTTVTANASDDGSVAGVQFFLDGATLGAEDTTAPFSTIWDTTAATDGSHTLTAQARDAAGNRGASAPVTVTVSNAAPPPPPPPPPPTDCSTPLTAFAGTTTFNNTVRAQLFIINNTWFGAFSDGSAGIFFYTLSGDSFVKGALIDAAAGGKPDVLWNGSELFIMIFKSGSLATLYKYSFSGGSFVLFPGFPVDLPLAGLALTVAVAQDSTGKLWATYTSGSNVHVIWSTSADHLTWNTTGVILEDNITTATTEAATIASFGGNKVGVVWSNQALAEYAFRFHLDGNLETTWSTREVVSCCDPDGPAGDDHVALRAAPDGRLFVVAKDSVGAGRIHMIIRSLSGVWGQKTLVDPDPSTQPTRPILTLDVQNNDAYVIYHNSLDKHVYSTHTAMASPSFTPRCQFLTSGNNTVGTKQGVNNTTGLVAAASVATQIFPGRIALGGAAAAAPAVAQFESMAPASAPAKVALQTEANTMAPKAPPRGEETPATDFEWIWASRMSNSRAPFTKSQWRWVRKQGVNTIVHLDPVMIDLAQFGFESYLWVPLRSGQHPTQEQAEMFLRFIQLSDNEPTHISGAAANARAVMVALARYAVEAWSIEDALAEGGRLSGRADLSTSQVAWLLSWAANHAPGSHRLGMHSPPRK